MAEFRDAKGRDWQITVTVATLRRARELAGVDLLRILDLDGGLLQRLADDSVLLADTLYACVLPNAAARGVGRDEFDEALHGDAVKRGLVALVESIPDFYPAPAMRRSRGAIAKAIRNEIERLMATTSPDGPGEPSSAAPPSSGSTPDPSPSGSSS